MSLIIISLSALALLGADPPRTTSLALRASQIVSQTQVLTIRMTLTNTSAAKAFWINKRWAVSHATGRPRATEIEITVVDAHQRLVPYLCSDLPETPRRSDYIVLKPGESVQNDLRFDPSCYDLIPGEKLRFSATFEAISRPITAEAGAEVPSERISLGDWIYVSVPAKRER